MAAANYFTQQGISVLLCDAEERKAFFTDIREKNGITVKWTHEDVKNVPDVITHDFAVAAEYADHILVCVSADRQKEVAERIAPYLGEQHSVLLSPGNGGSAIVKPILGEKILLGELGDNLCTCRMTGRAEVLVALPLSAKSVAAYPAKDTKALIQGWSPYLALKEGANIIETTLNSPNIVSHIAGCVLNTAFIERKGEDFALFEDGLSPSVIRVLACIEEERNKVLKRLGLRVYQSTIPLLTMIYEGGSVDFRAFQSLKGPESMQHRYITEDASCGVSLLISLAEYLKIDIPVTKAALCLAECINGEEYYKNGRTIEKLIINLKRL